MLRSWNDNWEELSAYFKYDAPIRKLIYTTNRRRLPQAGSQGNQDQGCVFQRHSFDETHLSGHRKHIEKVDSTHTELGIDSPAALYHV